LGVKHRAGVASHSDLSLYGCGDYS
jgi:hypothetical protein